MYLICLRGWFPDLNHVLKRMSAVSKGYVDIPYSCCCNLFKSSETWRRPCILEVMQASPKILFIASMKSRTCNSNVPTAQSNRSCRCHQSLEWKWDVHMRCKYMPHLFTIPSNDNFWDEHSIQGRFLLLNNNLHGRREQMKV